MQRWPQHDDGIIAIHPVFDFTLLQVVGNHRAQPVYAKRCAGRLDTCARS